MKTIQFEQQQAAITKQPKNSIINPIRKAYSILFKKTAEGCDTLKTIEIKHAILIVLSVVLLFSVLQLFGIYESFVIRMLNLILIQGGILLAVASYKKQYGKQAQYLHGLAVAIFTGFMATVMFLVGVIVCLEANTSYMELIMQCETFGWELNPFNIAGAFFVEGTTFSFVAGIIAANLVE